MRAWLAASTLLNRERLGDSYLNSSNHTIRHNTVLNTIHTALEASPPPALCGWATNER